MSFIDDNSPDTITRREWNWRIGGGAAPVAPFSSLVTLGNNAGLNGFGGPLNLLKTTNDGTTWSYQFNPQFPDADFFFFPVPQFFDNVGVVAFNGVNTWCAVSRWRNQPGTQTGVISAVSTDGGITWTGNRNLPCPGVNAPGTGMNYLPPGMNPNRLCWFPDRSEWIFVNTIQNTGNGVYRSANGITWTAVPGPAIGGGYGPLFYDPVTQSILFGAEDGNVPAQGILLRLDSSLNYTQLPYNAQLPNTQFFSYCRYGSVLVGAGSFTTPGGAVLASSTDNGVTWNTEHTSAVAAYSYVAEFAGNLIAFNQDPGVSPDLMSRTFDVFVGNLSDPPLSLSVPAAPSPNANAGVTGFTVKNGFAWLSMKSGQIYRSSDLINWTLRDTSAPVPTSALFLWYGLA